MTNSSDISYSVQMKKRHQETLFALIRLLCQNDQKLTENWLLSWAPLNDVISIRKYLEISNGNFSLENLKTEA